MQRLLAASLCLKESIWAYTDIRAVTVATTYQKSKVFSSSSNSKDITPAPEVTRANTEIKGSDLPLEAKYGEEQRLCLDKK